MASIENYLADLPDFVTPQDLANKLRINLKSVYQRHWRQSQDPKLNLLPPSLSIPGSRCLGWSKEVVIAWWESAIQPKITKRAGRPTKAEQIAKLEATS